jgi:hypothetical protein
MVCVVMSLRQSTSKLDGFRDPELWVTAGFAEGGIDLF